MGVFAKVHSPNSIWRVSEDDAEHREGEASKLHGGGSEDGERFHRFCGNKPIHDLLHVRSTSHSQT